MMRGCYLEQRSSSLPYYGTLDGITRVARGIIRANLKRMLWVAVLAGLGLGAYVYVSSPASVRVATVKTVETAETLGATGRVRGEKSVDLGLDMSGVVRSVYIRNGDKVRAGTVLLSLDRSDLQAGADASRAAVISAEAELTRVSRPPLGSDIRRAQAEIEQAKSVGAARVAQASARLRDLQAGTRSQEVAEAEADMRRQKALLGKAQADLRRVENLVKQGALAQSAMDDAITNVETSKATVAAQEQRVSVLKAGSRPSQIAEAEAVLTEARATRDTSIRAANESLNSLLGHPTSEDVAAARAKVNQARAELRRSSNMAGKGVLRAPFDGVVADLPVEEGQSVSPGQRLVVFEEISRPIVEVETDEANLKTLRVGQRAIVSSDAFPGRAFDAVLFDLGSRVDADRGTIRIRLRPTTAVTWMRPNLTVDVNIVTSASAPRIVLPADTLARVDGKQVVYVIRNGRAVPVPVTPGAIGSEGVAISGQLNDGDLVVRNGANVEANGSVKPVGDR